VSSESELLQKAAAHNEEAFLTIWKRHRDAVYRFAAWMLYSERDTAEDVTQQTFLELLQKPEKFKAEEGSLRTYLFAIARNLCRNRLRKIHPDEDLDFEGESAPSDCLDGLIARERVAALQSAIESLPALQREALFLFEYEELSLSEVATILNIDTNTLKARLHRARQRLKRELLWMKI
jgi:RNA polymerase sigma-70 factor (ECF subfamily)